MDGSLSHGYKDGTGSDVYRGSPAQESGPTIALRTPQESRITRLSMAFLNRFRRSGNPDAQATTTSSIGKQEFVGAGDIKYAVEQGGNDSGPSYQDVSGAPVEVKSPLGYSVGGITILFLNISMMIGTGVYSTREFAEHKGHV